MKKVIYMVLFAVFIILFLLCAKNFAKVKSAIKENELSVNEPYILVEIQYSSSSPWIITGGSEEYFPTDIEDVMIIGDKPKGFNYELENGGNTFVCYGEFSGELSDNGAKIFIAEDWDILYPIKRNSMFDLFLPDSYICRYDILI